MSKQDTTKRRRERALNNRTTTGYRISDHLWEVLQPLLPKHVNTHRFGRVRPRVPDRECAEAIFYVLLGGEKPAPIPLIEARAGSNAACLLRNTVYLSA